jgi:hypothetical protein
VALLTRKVFNTRYDHIGMVVKDRFGVAHVCEGTMLGVRLRRFDERVSWSKSEEIIALPLEHKPSEEARQKAERYARCLTPERRLVYLKPSHVLVMELAGLYKYWTAQRQHVTADAAHMGEALSSSRDVALMLVLLEKMGLIESWEAVEQQCGPAQFISPADLEQGKLPLLNNRYMVGEEGVVRLRDRSTMERR